MHNLLVLTRHQLIGSLSLPIKASLVYASVNLLFSFSSFSQPTGRTIQYGDVQESSPHMLTHLLLGIMTGFPTMSVPYVLTSAGLSVLLDLDHLLSFLGYKVYGRPSHSLVFGAISGVLLALAFRKNKHLDWTLFAVSWGSFASHLGYDSVTSAAGFPLIFPLSPAMTRIGGQWAPALQALAMLIVLLARSEIRKIVNLKWPS